MPRLKYAARALALLLIAGCSEPTAPARAPVEGAQRVIADAGHGGTAHFYFLSPIVKHEGPFSGTFDGTLQPTVTVCELAGTVCGATVATFTTAGHGSDAVRVDGAKYKVNFHSGDFSLSTQKQYRINVSVDGVLLGYADMVVVRSGGDKKDVDENQFVVLKNGSTLSIAFRIEQGIAGGVVVSPSADTVAVGQTAQFTATVTDLHGVVIPGAPVTWSSQPAAVATVDANGLATGVSVGSATITATSGTASGSASLEVLTPNHPPVAVSDTFQAIGNVTVPVAAPGVLAHDSDPDGNSLSVVPGTVATAQGGTVTFAADGSFSYLSAPGFTGTDSVAYVLTDGSAADTAQAVFNVASRVWYVRNTGPAPGDGRDASPFATLAQAQAASAVGETIFVLFGDATTNGVDAGIVLKAGQSLIGQGISTAVTVSLNGQTVTLLAPGAVPTVGRTSPGAAVSLATNNTVRGVFVSASAGAGFEGDGLGTLTISEASVSATGGPGADLRNGVLNVTLGSLSSSASTTAGLYLSGVAGSFSANAGSIAGAAAAGVQLSGGSADVVYGGSVDAVTGRSVAITGRTGGTATLSGDLSDHAAGILVQGNSSGLVEFTGGSKTIATGGAGGVTLSSNSGASVRFAGGGLAISTTTGNGFSATGGGSVVVTGADNTVSSAGGVAVEILNTTIGVSGVMFRSVSASGGANGIHLENTGVVGGFGVSGAGSAGSGGSIAGMTGADGSSSGTGVYLQNVHGVLLGWMDLHDFQNFGIRGTGVSDFTLSNSAVGGVNGDNPALDEGSISFSGLTGSASVIATTVAGGTRDNFRVANTAGTLDRLTISSSIFGNNGVANGRDGVHLEAAGSAVLNATVENSVFSGARTFLLSLDLQNSAVSDLVLQGNTFRNTHPAIVPGAGGVSIGSSGAAANPSLTYHVVGNSFRDASGAGLSVLKGAGTGSFAGTISGNTVGVAGLANSGSAQGSGLSLASVGGGVHTVLVANNQIRQYNNQGVLVQIGDAASGGNGTLNATLAGNTIAEPGSAPTIKNGVNLNAGTSTGDQHGVCLAMSGNTLTGSGSGGAAGTDFRLRQRFLTTVVLPGYAGANNDNAAVVAFEQANNPGAPTGSAANAVSTGGGGFVGGAACPQP
ncbi:MAG TPA: Ig-like domain-containing protein [Longimicrobiaceae bacterium]|jgi:hypothetical protein|nr:Ig-like domain-containing protein [Longimicrobiaceae bacterium]